VQTPQKIMVQGEQEAGSIYAGIPAENKESRRGEARTLCTCRQAEEQYAQNAAGRNAVPRVAGRQVVPRRGSSTGPRMARVKFQRGNRQQSRSRNPWHVAML